ncbi:hypothetical protein BDE36_1763 [Arcticibacter tournemirensis]|uniref:Uncharacterized protein n=1 Tax=Arcticibacter tournemirensis TaxID=699437 RepID=A0A5M9HAT1_9SPHI|nr:hypothetical protein [Arcticibacter tournemirensis]KAA8483770.1 hypothetical protein F1649_07735 [Arcticibacter tournemirensis]TQM50028.1 hypothetical protein BDE36_1763 [Arcticibacter tournemirensis]
MAAPNKRPINVQKEVDAWARITIDRFQKVLKQKKIGKTGALMKSFTRQLQLKNGDVDAVLITFAMHGRFRDMGVGRGLKAYERYMNKGNQVAVKSYGAKLNYIHRGAKRWFNKPKMAEIYRLREILAKSVGDAVVTNVHDDLSTYTSYRVNL